MYIFQIFLSIVIILMVVFSVGKTSDGIMGLMGTTEIKNKPIVFDKPTKVMFCMLVIFLVVSFAFSLMIAHDHASLIK
jgi:hypothetical protein